MSRVYLQGSMDHVHGPTEYTLLYIDTTGKQEILLYQTKRRTSKGWPKCPTEVKFYKDNWSMGRRYDRPIDLSEQVDNYKKKMDKYKGEKEEYNTFYEEQLKKIPKIETPSSEERDEKEELRKRKANEEKFLVFASKHHPIHQKAEAEETKTRSKE
jgi:hypothetical protein